MKSFARIGDYSGLMCFRTTTGISSGPVAVGESSFLISFPISLEVEVTENLLMNDGQTFRQRLIGIQTKKLTDR